MSYIKLGVQGMLSPGNTSVLALLGEYPLKDIFGWQ